MVLPVKSPKLSIWNSIRIVTGLFVDFRIIRDRMSEKTEQGGISKNLERINLI